MAEIDKLEKNLASLVQEGAETSKILRSAGSLLALRENHTMGLKCKAICSMLKEKFGIALATLNEVDRNGKSFNKSLATASPELFFQRCYCLYRMRRYTEAKMILERTTQASLLEHIPSLHLLAQLHYNIGNTAEAALIYGSLLQKGKYRDNQERLELLINYIATLSSSYPRKAIDVFQDSDLYDSDLAFNVAIAYIEDHKYEAALTVLEEAESLCYKHQHTKSSVKSLKEVLAFTSDQQNFLLRSDIGAVKLNPEHRFFNSVVNIWIQMAFVYHKQQREEDAARILELILRCQPSSPVARALATVNWMAIGRQNDSVDFYRNLWCIQHEKVMSRFVPKQMLAVRYSIALFYLNTNNLSSCRKLTKRLIQDYPHNEFALSLKLALAVRKSKKKKVTTKKNVQEHLRDIAAYLQVEDVTMLTNNKLITLMIAQFLIDQGDLASALEVLQYSIVADVAGSPSGVATRVSWEVQLGNIIRGLSLLYSALQTSKVCQSNAKKLLLYGLNLFEVVSEQGDNMLLYEELVHFLQRVRSDITLGLQNDPELTVLLAKYLTKYDLKAAKEKMAEFEKNSTVTSINLPVELNIHDIESNLPDRESLERLGYRRLTTLEIKQLQQPSISADNNNNTVAENRAWRHSNRKRSIRRPAKDMNGRPDPERWIPMSERSYIKDLPERRKRELKRLRALEQEQIKRRVLEKKKTAAVFIGEEL